MKKWLKKRFQSFFGILILKEYIEQIISDLNNLNIKVHKLEQNDTLPILYKKIEEINTRQIQTLQQKETLTTLEEKIEEISHDTEKSTRLINQVFDIVLKKNHSSVFWGDRLLSLDKTMGFRQEPKFKTAHYEIIGSHQYDQYNQDAGIAWRLHTLVWAAKNGLNLPGDFVECGVFKGDMSWVIAQCLDFEKVSKTFYLFDTFDGFSEKYSSTEDFPENSQLFEIADKIYKDPNLYEYVKNRFNPYSNVKVIKGVVPDTFLEESPSQIAFLHIDLNSPAPEIGVLNNLFDRVVSGGMIIFDDYGWLPFKKQKVAEDQWMAQRGYSILELPTGQGLVVKR